MKKLLCLTFLMFCITLYSQEERSKTPIIGTKIYLGETVDFDGVSIKFVEVMEDSRCPKNVDCIWAGRAIAKIEVSSIGMDTYIKQIIFGEIKANESTDKNIYSQDDLSIEALAIEPYPVYAGKILEYYILVSKM
jgi:hypothetical protein